RAAAAGSGKSKQEKSMTEEKKQSILERLSALFRDDDAGASGSSERAIAALEKANKTLAQSLVDTACASQTPAIKEAVLPLALLAVQADGGEIGAASQAFTALASASKSPIDMRASMIAQIAEQPHVK